jgi:hypothetical protein
MFWVGDVDGDGDGDGDSDGWCLVCSDGYLGSGVVRG